MLTLTFLIVTRFTSRKKFRLRFVMLSFRGIASSTTCKFSCLIFSYTAFYLASTEGLPLIRPLWFEFPADETLFNQEQSYMFGGSVLVSPRLMPDSRLITDRVVGNSESLFTEKQSSVKLRDVLLPSQV
jgi:hypothetical protein